MDAEDWEAEAVPVQEEAVALLLLLALLETNRSDPTTTPELVRNQEESKQI